MKKNGKVRIAGLCFALAATLILSALTLASLAYDGTNDPLISYTYLKANVLDKLSELSDRITGNGGELAALRQELAALKSQQNGQAASGYEVVYARRGQVVRATVASDFMLRSGEAYALVPADSGGSISDYTDGTDLLNGNLVPLNHMLLIPRGDGRGLVILSDEAYIMVRGGYTVEG